jgi:glycyl-tRNA synthetase
MAEIEYFHHPAFPKKHSRFQTVASENIRLLSRDTQQNGGSEVNTMTIGQAVETKLVDNEILGYFLAKIHIFLTQLVGIDPQKLRFRQHMANELSHYSSDTWDAEILTSFGWVECVGCADRSAYDLTMHSKASGTPIVVREKLESPRETELFEGVLNKKLAGPKLKSAATVVETQLQQLSQDLLEKLSLELDSNGQIELDTPSGKISLGKDLLAIRKEKRTEHYSEYIPAVIEVSKNNPISIFSNYVFAIFRHRSNSLCFD